MVQPKIIRNILRKFQAAIEEIILSIEVTIAKLPFSLSVATGWGRLKNLFWLNIYKFVYYTEVF